MKIYEVYIATNNPSMNMAGYFDDIAVMNKKIDDAKEAATKYPLVYSKIEDIDIKEIEVTNEWD